VTKKVVGVFVRFSCAASAVFYPCTTFELFVQNQDLASVHFAPFKANHNRTKTNEYFVFKQLTMLSNRQTSSLLGTVWSFYRVLSKVNVVLIKAAFGFK
jgi:hypothetical protein